MCSSFALKFNKLYILTIYRFSRCNITDFLNLLDLILEKLLTNICGDINVNYLIDSCKKSQIVAVTHSYNLISTVKFPTKIALNSHSATDSVSIDISNIAKYDLNRLINVLSDHNGQLLIVYRVQKQEKECHTGIKRNVILTSKGMSY
jgi:hypothetical protein